jgi:hypothetical protein
LNLYSSSFGVLLIEYQASACMSACSSNPKLA